MGPVPAEAAAVAFVERSKRAFPGRIVEARLFGSVARGAATGDSDIDVLIVWDGDHDEGLRSLAGLAFDMLLDDGAYVSVTVLTPDEFAAGKAEGNRFVEAVLEEGRAIG